MTHQHTKEIISQSHLSNQFCKLKEKAQLYLRYENAGYEIKSYFFHDLDLLTGPLLDFALNVLQNDSEFDTLKKLFDRFEVNAVYKLLDRFVMRVAPYCSDKGPHRGEFSYLKDIFQSYFFNDREMCTLKHLSQYHTEKTVKKHLQSLINKGWIIEEGEIYLLNVEMLMRLNHEIH